jgi:HK97 family phage major capsid protein
VDERRISIAVSSEEPVERAFGDEILSHTADAIDLKFFGSGRAPLLHDHDPAKPVGVVESATLGADKVFRAVVRFGKSPLATEVYNDVVDGIRVNSSVGYSVREWKSLPDDAGFRITKWSPREVSIVSIPADPSVGVGRSRKETSMSTEYINDVRSLFERYNVTGFATFARDNAKLDEAAFREAAKSHVLANLPDDKPMQTPAVHIPSERVANPLAFIRSIASGDRRGAEYEHDESQRVGELARRAGMKLRGAAIPIGWLAPVNRAAIPTTGFADMQSIEHLSGHFVEPLRAASQVLGLGAQVLPLTQDALIPVWPAGAVPAWVGEGSAPADSVPTTDNVPFTYHGLRATLHMTARALFQSLPALDDTFRKDATKAIAGAVDKAAISGSGVAPEPRGILNTTGIGLVAMGTNGAALTWAKTVELRKAVKAENIVGNSFGWLSNSNVEAAMLSTDRGTDTGKFILSDENPDKLIGDPIRFSANIPSNGSKGTGTNRSTLIYGNWSDLIVGMFGVVETIVDPYTESAAGNVRITLGSAWDFGVRYPESFAAIRDIVAA